MSPTSLNYVPLPTSYRVRDSQGCLLLDIEKGENYTAICSFFSSWHSEAQSLDKPAAARRDTPPQENVERETDLLNLQRTTTLQQKPPNNGLSSILRDIEDHNNSERRAKSAIDSSSYSRGYVVETVHTFLFSVV